MIFQVFVIVLRRERKTVFIRRYAPSLDLFYQVHLLKLYLPLRYSLGILLTGTNPLVIQLTLQFLHAIFKFVSRPSKAAQPCVRSFMVVPRVSIVPNHYYTVNPLKMLFEFCPDINILFSFYDIGSEIHEACEDVSKVLFVNNSPLLFQQYLRYILALNDFMNFVLAPCSLLQTNLFKIKPLKKEQDKEQLSKRLINIKAIKQVGLGRKDKTELVDLSFHWQKCN